MTTLAVVDRVTRGAVMRVLPSRAPVRVLSLLFASLPRDDASKRIALDMRFPSIVKRHIIVFMTF